MAGPSIMALGPFVFQAHGFGFDRRKKALDTRWAEIEVAGGLNPVQWTGGAGAEETIRGAIFPHEFGGLSTLEALQRAAIDGQVLPFVTLGGGPQNIFGMWVVEGVDEDHEYIDSAGVPGMDAYQISIRAYQGAVSGFQPLSILGFF